jgi:hypothetical protein
VESSTWKLASEAGAARRARAWVRDVLPGLVTMTDVSDSPVLADAVLCVSELVNASLLARSTSMVLRLSRDQETVRLSLVDNGVAVVDQQGAAAHAQQLGFRMIDAVVERWGIDATDDGRELWVALSVNGHTQSPCL